jgi:hypothetical protein
MDYILQQHIPFECIIVIKSYLFNKDILIYNKQYDLINSIINICYIMPSYRSLLYASMHRQWDFIARMLSYHNKEYRQPHNREFIMVDNIIAAGRIDIIKTLMFKYDLIPTQSGANVASANNRFKIVKLLLEKNIYCSPIGINWAAQNNHYDMVKLLLSLNKFCTHDGVDEIINNQQTKMIRLLIEHAPILRQICSKTGIYHAIKHNDIEMLTILFDKYGTNHSLFNNNCIFISIIYNNIEALNFFLKNLQSFQIYTTRSAKLANWACRNGQNDIICILYSNNLYCDKIGIKYAVMNKHLSTVILIYLYYIYWLIRDICICLNINKNNISKLIPMIILIITVLIHVLL